MTRVVIPIAQWEWFGVAAHFIGGRKCRFHLATRVGAWLVSTVGEYHLGLSADEAPTPLGADEASLYETYVFRAGKPCDRDECKCGLPEQDGHEVEGVRCGTRGEAQSNHIAACVRYASKQEVPNE